MRPGGGEHTEHRNATTRQVEDCTPCSPRHLQGPSGTQLPAQPVARAAKCRGPRPLRGSSVL